MLHRVRASAVAALVVALVVMTGCSDDSTAGEEPSGPSGDPTSEAADPTDDPTEDPVESPTEQPSEEPTEELGGPTLDQEGVLMTLPEGFSPDRGGLTSQKTSQNRDGLYVAISTLGTVTRFDRDELVERLLKRSGIAGRPTVAEEDVELDGVSFVNVFGRYDSDASLRWDYLAGMTDELDITIAYTTPRDWSEGEREAYLQPIFDAVVIP